jgi:hypothetical protein
MGRVALVALGSCLVACGTQGEDERFAKAKHEISAPLDAAYCSVSVTGVGTIDMETDYLPHVVQCENGGANLQALKAQAIAARSVAYYNMASQGSICDGQGCQVYSCGATPNAAQIQAVQETSGQYLSYGGMLTYGFYVAGDSGVSPPSCVGSSGSTEGYVTYNEGKSGTAVEQTTLGYVGPPGFGQNRGCMSQWSARCLENSNGYDYLSILRFFYGADIGILTAPGPCVTPTTPTLDAVFVAQGSDATADDEGKAQYKACAGEPVTFWFELGNTGTATWVDVNGNEWGQSVRLGVPDDSNDPFLGKNRISLNENTNDQVDAAGSDCNDQPGCRRTVFSTNPASSAVTPDTPGVYTTRWRLVDEGRAWFGPEMSLTFNVVECTSGSGGSGGAGSNPASGGKGAGPGQSTSLVPESDEGCSCRAAGERGASAWWLCSIALFGVRRLRRRI